MVPGSFSSVFSENASATCPIDFEMRTCAAVRCGYARALLAAMLQRVQTEVGEVGSFGMTEDAEDAAFLFQLVVGPDLARRG